MLIVGRDGSTSGGIAKWSAVCDCGNVVTIQGSKIRTGETRSCGCFRADRASQTKRKHGEAGVSGIRSREYNAWSHAKQRCFNENSKEYIKWYGSRGITMTPEWANSFEAFLRDMGRCPPGLTLERKDVNGNYEKGNCKWATQKEQQNNRRNTGINRKEIR